MAIRIRCSGCQAPLTVGDEFAGAPLCCPHCKSVTLVSSAASSDQFRSSSGGLADARAKHITDSPRRRQDDSIGEDSADRPKRRRRKKSIRPWLLVGVLVLVALIAVAVFVGVSIPVASMNDAETTVDKYFRALSNKDWDTALGLYAPEFYQKMPEEQWRQVLPNLGKKLGDYQSRKLTNWRVWAGTAGSQVMLNYEVQYTKAAASETFSFIGKREGEPLLIVGHQVNSPAFLAPNN